MYCRDPQILAVLSKRIRLYRRAILSLPLFALAMIFTWETLHAFPTASPELSFAGYVATVILIAGTALGFGMLMAWQGGAVKCPVCGEPYAERRVGHYNVPRADCPNCGYSVLTGHKPGDF
jgi:hypothetical protein